MQKVSYKSRNGFTLIELLVVIGILAVLAAIAIPAVAGLIDRANVSADLTNANEMTNAIERFTSEYELYCQDIASGSLVEGNYDSAQGRVYNVTNAKTRSDIEALEKDSTAAVSTTGRAIYRDTKYPVNAETVKAIVENYTKTSSSTFDPKQSDMHFWYSPDCGIVVVATPTSTVAEKNKLILSGKDAKGNTLSDTTKWIDLTQPTATTPAETRITFTVAGTTYTTKEGNTWGEWIHEFGMGSDGNGIIWIGLDASTVYLDINYPNHSTRLPGAEDRLYRLNANGTVGALQTVGMTIVDGANYGVNPQCCFDAGSQVLMADGTTKNIEDIVIGDVVMSLNEDTGEFIPQVVSATIVKHNSDDLVYVNLSNGVQIGMRAYHPLLTVDGWKSLRPTLAETTTDVGIVELLEVGNTLVGYDGNVTIVSIETRPDVENYDTYNLSIDGYHNYIVNGVVVHNAGCPT